MTSPFPDCTCGAPDDAEPEDHEAHGRATRHDTVERHSINPVSAQPIHQEPDPRDPMAIYDRLPEPARAKFVTEYHAAVDAAHDFAGYRKFQEMLRTWSVLAAAYSKPDFPQRYQDIAASVGQTVPMDEVLPHSGA